MRYNPNNITRRITSNDENVLKRSLIMINELLENEVKRGESTIQRITILFTLGSLTSALVLFFGQYIINNIQSGNSVLIYLVYATILFFLGKTFYYLVKPLKVRVENRISPEIVCDIQDKDEIESLRHEIIYKIWEYYQRIGPNTENLFYFSRGERNLSYAFIFSFLLAALLLVNIKTNIIIPEWIEWIIGISFLLFALFCDFIMDKFGFWKF